MKYFSLFTKKTGIIFNDQELLKQAFTHRSYLNEHPGQRISHNERLEFLGDAVLELAVTDYLFRKFPERQEGELTAFRAALVNTMTLSDVAGELGFNELLLLSRGETKDIGKARQYILANTYEAVIGAVYLDQSYKMAAQFIENTIIPRLEGILEGDLWLDAKSHVQEKAQELLAITPVYKVLEESGPDHDKHFTVGVFFGEEQAGVGDGKSKQEAEQNAARNALKEKKWE